MRLPAVPVILVAFLAAIGVPCLSSGDLRPQVVPPQPVCPPIGPAPVIIEGDIEGVGPLIRATGGILFMQGNRRVTADEALYDPRAPKGVMSNVVLTTCTHTPPHYRLKARQVSLLPNNKLRAKGISLFLGGMRVLMLPSIKLRIGGRAASTSVFPTPGYDKRDGFSLSQGLRLADTNRARTVADLRFTTRHGVQVELDSIYGLDGELVAFPGRFLTYDSLRSNVLTMPREPVGWPCDPQGLRPVGAARLRTFGKVTSRQRTYDIKDTGLVVNAQPQVGLHYIGRQLNVAGQPLDPRIEIYPEITASWGRFKEMPGLDWYTTRGNVSVVAGLNFLPLGPSTTVQPVGSYRYSRYGNGDNYRETAFAIDASHMFPNNSFASVRYIRRHATGATPFQFDDLDIRQECQAAFQARMKRHVFGMVASYDLGAGDLYEWEALYGYSTDCIATWIRWNSRFKRLVLNVSLVNL